MSGNVMNIRKELLSILCCPRCRSELVGEDEALRCQGCTTTYPVVDGIPIFVQVDDLVAEKRILKDFYESFGWQKGEGDSIYKSHARYGFTSETLVRHRRIVNRAQQVHFDPEGEYFLDCASGAIPAEEYLEYSSGYRFHVCVDLTLSALAGARLKLSDRGLYVNADATRLPFREGTFDAILSSHTVYHIPKGEQEKAINEFSRILRPGRKCVIYYNVGQNSLFGVVFRPLVWLRRKFSDKRRDAPPMYSYHYPATWFRRFGDRFSNTEIKVYKFFPNQLMKYAFPSNPVSNALGNIFLGGVRWLERRHALYRLAQYVTVVFAK